MSAIAKVYWRSVKRGVRTFADVPEKLKGEVRELAAAELANGTISGEEYERLIGGPEEA